MRRLLYPLFLLLLTSAVARAADAPTGVTQTGGAPAVGASTGAVPGTVPKSRSVPVVVSGIAYAGVVNYSGASVESEATLAGAYGYLGYGLTNSLEAEIDYSDITRHSLSPLRQWDGTLIYSNYSLTHWKLRAGIHALTSDDASTTGGVALLTGADYYIYGKWDAGLDADLTHYPHYQPGLDVDQLSPHGGVTIPLKGFTLRGDLRGYWIHLTDSEGLNGTDFFSIEPQVSAYWKKWTFTGMVWAGQQAFAIRNDGFALYNLVELHHGGEELQARYVLSPRSSLTARWSREQFTETGGGSARADTFLGLFGVSF